MQQTPTTYLSKDKLATHADPQRQNLARQYAKDIPSVIWILLVVLILSYEGFLFLPFIGGGIRNWATNISTDAAFVVAFYTILVGGASLLAFAPIAHAFGYVRPKKYGMISITHKAWWKKHIRSNALILIDFLIVVELFYWLVRTLPDYWWIGVSICWIVILFLGAFDLRIKRRSQANSANEGPPITIDEEITRRFAALVDRASLPAIPLRIRHVSKESKHVNAWFLGMGNGRRIEVSDTM